MQTRISKNGSINGFWSSLLVIVILLTGYARVSSAVTTQIAAGAYHTVSIRDDGTVWVWGDNSFGQLGDGSTTQSSAPVQVTTLSGMPVTAVEAGAYHTVALRKDGTVWTWGYNDYGQLGNGSTAQSSIPVQVSALSGMKMTAVAAGVYHTVALRDDGTVWVWGSNDYGQLGDSSNWSSTPVQLTALSGMVITAVAAGDFHTVALRMNGTLWAWGGNEYGQLGNGSTTRSSFPVQVRTSGVTAITAVSAGFSHTLAVAEDGTAWAWGYNLCGQLGNGSTTSSNTPVQVTGLSGMNVTAVSAGGVHSVALINDGSVWAWGDNSFGQLGNGDTTQSNTPVQVTNLSGMSITAVVAGDFHTLSLREDGTVLTWGETPAP